MWSEWFVILLMPPPYIHLPRCLFLRSSASMSALTLECRQLRLVSLIPSCAGMITESVKARTYVFSPLGTQRKQIFKLNELLLVTQSLSLKPWWSWPKRRKTGWRVLEISLQSLWDHKTRKQLKMAIFHPHFQILYSN